MEAFNFDEAHFRKVIAKSQKTEVPPSLNQLLIEGIQKFHEEFDYYPNLAVTAPGTFTIAGEYAELFNGLLVQAALPLTTVIVAKWNGTLKCRIVTSCLDVDEPYRMVFPAVRCHPFKKGYPKWVNLLKGVMNNFIRRNKKGFDAVIHSSIPICQGFGSSAALETAFHILLERLLDERVDFKTLSNAKKCKIADEKFGESSTGSFSNYTTFFAESRNVVLLNTSDSSLEFFSFRDPNILFLLTIPNEDLLGHPKDLIRMRETELKLAAKLLDLEDIGDAEEHHLEVLASMGDPSREKVIAILRQFESDKHYISEFVREFFKLPNPEVYEEVPTKYDFIAEYGEERLNSVEEEIAGESFTKLEYKTVCDEVVCLGGISEVSVRSDLTVISKLVRRLRYLIMENQRVRSLKHHVTNLDYVSAGEEIIRSHLSLKIDFEVSSPAMDELVQFTAQLGTGVFGSKMMRNGATLTLVHRNSALSTVESIREKFGENFRFYLMFPSQGARKLDLTPPNMPKSSLSETYSTIEELVKRGVENFEATYQRYPTHGHYSPATIKLLGDHCEYNESYSLSMALNMVTLVVGALNGSGKIRIAMTADVHPQKVMFPIPSIQPVEPGRVKWANYVRGVISHFEGYIPGFDCLIETSVPLGGQIFSNASVEVAMYRFLEELTGYPPKDDIEKASLCMTADHVFTNTVCGIGDFLVSLKGLENQLILLDCKKCNLSYLPLFDPGLVFLLVYDVSGWKPSKIVAYIRLEECYDVAKALGLHSLRCAKEEDLNGLEGVSKEAIKRAKHVITEGKRVLAGAEALQCNEAEKFGRLMVESHISLRDDFEFSSRSIDVVDRAMEVDGVLGARMTGSEYGSSALIFLKLWAADDVIDYIRETCDGEWKYYLLTPSGGSDSIDVKKYLNSLPGPAKTFEKVFHS